MSLGQAWFGTREEFSANEDLFRQTGRITPLEAIVERLNEELPQRLYFCDADLADFSGVSKKTIENRRALYPEKYPAPIYIGGVKKPQYPRVDVVRWLADQEYRAKVVHLHRCR